jgi:hypothetical protein
MKTKTLLASAGFLFLLASTAWAGIVVSTRPEIHLGKGWGRGAHALIVSSADPTSLAIAVNAGSAHRAYHPRVEVSFAKGEWENIGCSVSSGWNVESISNTQLLIHFAGKPGSGELLSAIISCHEQ